MDDYILHPIKFNIPKIIEKIIFIKKSSRKIDQKLLKKITKMLQ